MTVRRANTQIPDSVYNATLNSLYDRAMNGELSAGESQAILRSRDTIDNSNNGYNRYSPNESESTTRQVSTSSGVQSQSSNGVNRASGVSYNDYTLTPEQQAERQARVGAAAAPYDTFSSIVGADREKVARQRQKQIEDNNRRAKIAALTDSARVISDMITAGMGGNVYRRDKDTTAKDAIDANNRLKELQNAEDAQYNMQLWKNNLDKSVAMLNAGDRYDEMRRKQVSNSISTSANNSIGRSASNTISASDQQSKTKPLSRVAGGYVDKWGDEEFNDD